MPELVIEGGVLQLEGTVFAGLVHVRGGGMAGSGKVVLGQTTLTFAEGLGSIGSGTFEFERSGMLSGAVPAGAVVRLRLRDEPTTPPGVLMVRTGGSMDQPRDAGAIVRKAASSSGPAAERVPSR